jgi:predicted nucleic acid-binding protein
MSSVNWAECRHLVTRRHGAATAEELLSKIGKGVEIVAADRAQADLVGNLRCRFNASLADCFAACLAIDRRATLVTADPEFEALRREIKIMRLEAR